MLCKLSECLELETRRRGLVETVFIDKYLSNHQL